MIAAAPVVTLEAGATSALDAAAAGADPAHGFLRSAWFAAAAGSAPATTLSARRATGEVIAAIALVSRKLGPLAVQQVPGSYWPYRSFAVAVDATVDELAALLVAPQARAGLGRAWRLGPVPADDPTFVRLAAAAPRAGWSMLSRRVATCYTIDIAQKTAGGPWPSTKRLQRNRWLERRLARDHGELSFASFAGDDWSSGGLDALAAVERESWVVRDGGDAKFQPGAPPRAIWERATADWTLAARLKGWTMQVGDQPGAFVFSLDAGNTRHIIANGYNERFSDHSPGMMLLYRVFSDAVAQGMRTIDWGAGDAGYKSQVGAEPKPELLDLLFVRGRMLAAAAAPLWRRFG